MEKKQSYLRKYINIKINKTSSKTLQKKICILYIYIFVLFCLYRKTYTSKINTIIRHSGIIKEKLATFKRQPFFLLFETALICSLFHVCCMWKRTQETLCTAADLSLFARHSGIIGALGRILVEKQHGFTDRLSLTYVSLSASLPTQYKLITTCFCS